MELYIFFKSDEKNENDYLVDIDYFRYPEIDEKLVTAMENGIAQINKRLNFANAVNYNPLSIERGKNKLEKISVDVQIEESEFFEILKSIILDNKLTDYKVSINEKKYRFRNVHKFKEAQYPVFFYVIKIDGKAYFKKSSDNNLMMENKNNWLVRRDTAEKVDTEELMSINARYDFVVDNDFIYIRSGNGFEQILRYEDVFKKHKDIIINKIKDADIINDFEEFEKTCNNAKYYRAFKVIKTDIDFKAAFSNKEFLDRLNVETKGNIKWNEENKKIELKDAHIKTVLHIFSGLIGIDIYGEIVLFNQKYLLPK